MGQFIVVIADEEGQVYKTHEEGENAEEVTISAIQKAFNDGLDTPEVCTDFTQFDVIAVYPEFSDLTDALDEDNFSIFDFEEY